MKITYPVYDITGVELFYDDDGTVYTHIPNKGGTLILDCTAIDDSNFGIRRAILRGKGAPLYPLNRGIADVVGVVLSKARQIIDSRGQVFNLSRSTKKRLKTYQIKEIYTGNEDGKYVLVLKQHTKRVVVEELPPFGHIFVTFLQDDRLGDIFAGYSSIPQDKMVRA